jgi:hypothetical protein
MIEFSQIIINILCFCIVFGLFVYWIQHGFIPFYKNYLREKIREYIIRSRLDVSGKQIYKNMIEPERLLLIFQSIEKLFGLDNNPLISVFNESPSKCMLT